VDPAHPGAGHLHLLRRGTLRWQGPEGSTGDGQELREPSLLFFPRPTAHALQTDDAELVCAAVQFGAQWGNPLLAGLPSPWVLKLSELPSLARVLDLFFDEAMAERCGRQAALDRWAELLVIELLRQAFSRGLLQLGPLAALGDARLAKALTALHEDPSAAWSLERLAELAGMSRARFAAHFAQKVGTPPGEYLTGLRIALAQQRLARGDAAKRVAEAVGYGSPGALARAFQQRVGLSPAAWLRAQA
jgi:AraC-like DNA-binding protein